MPGPDVGRGRATALADILSYLMALCILGMGLLGMGILFIIRNIDADRVQPYAASASDLEAEKRMQQSKLELFQAAARATPPPSLAMTEAKPATPPAEAAVPPAAKGRNRKPTGKRPAPPEQTRPKAHPMPLTDNLIAKQSSKNDFFLPSVTLPVAPVPKAPLVAYITGEVAIIHLALRDIASRTAITEDAIRQLRETKSWYEWLVLAGSVLATFYGMGSLLAHEIGRRREQRTAHAE